MSKQLRIYRKVETMFDSLLENSTNYEIMKGYPKTYPEQDYTEDNVVMMTMKDGTIIEICDWHDGDIYVRDFSVEKTAIDKVHDCSFEKYAESMGMYVEDIEVHGVKWHYVNQGEKCGSYRLQYYIECDDYMVDY